jgi:hypothetical protein
MDMSSDAVRSNLLLLISPETRDIALSESVGGNAGPSCYALNLRVDDAGRITYVGNSPDEVNATLRVYVPFFSSRNSKLDEMAIEVTGEIPERARGEVARSAWLWNLYARAQERALLDRFLEGHIAFDTLVELLRSKFPRLAEELAG